jgi:hypothetical protein
MGRKRSIVLLAGEALFLRRRDNTAVCDEAGGRVVVVSGNTENVGRQLSELRDDERLDSACGNRQPATGKRKSRPINGGICEQVLPSAVCRIPAAVSKLKQRVDERRHRARLREDDQQSEEHEDDHDRHQPVLLFLPKELPELCEHTTLSH